MFTPAVLKVFHWIVSYLHLSNLLLDRISLGLEIIWRHAMIADNKHFGWSGSTLFTYFTFISQFSNSKLHKCQAIIEWHPFAQLRTSAWWPLDSPKLLCSLVEFMSYHLHILSECMFSVARLTLCALDGGTTMTGFSNFCPKIIRPFYHLMDCKTASRNTYCLQTPPKFRKETILHTLIETHI